MSPMRQSARTWANSGAWVYGLLVCLGLGLRALLVPAPLTYGSDIWRQSDTATIAQHFYEGGYRLLWPQISWGGDGPGYVETELQLYPLLVALMYGVAGRPAVWLGRLVSLIFTAGAMAYFVGLARRALPRRAALWAVGFVCLSPLHVRYSAAFMPEATVLFFYVAALYYFQRFLDEDDRLWLLAAAACTALAVLVKPTAIHIGLFQGLLLWARRGAPGFRRVDIWLCGGAALVPAAVFYYFHARELYLVYGNTFGVMSGGDSKFGDLSYWLSPKFYLALFRLERVWLLTEVGVGLLAVGLWVALQRGRHGRLLPVLGMGTIFLYYLIVARYASERWGIHYHLFALPYAAIGIGLGASFLVGRAPPRWRVLLGAVLVLGLLGRAGLRYRELLREEEPDPRVTCAAAVQALTRPGELIIASSLSSSVERGRPNNYQDPVLFFYSDRRGFSLPLDRHEPQELQQAQRRGARYFVIFDGPTLQARPALAAYLGRAARQIGPGVERGCGVYLLLPESAGAVGAIGVSDSTTGR